MTKNIIMLPCYRAKNYVARDNDFDLLRKITNLAVESMRRFVVGVDEIRVFGEGQVIENGSLIDLEIIKQTIGTWYAEDVNILLLESDMLCLKPVDIFGRFQKMMMFALIRSSTELEHQNPFTEITLRHHMNSGVIYFPASMSTKCWDEVRRRCAVWDTQWAYKQFVWNAAFYSQFPTMDEGLDEVKKVPLSYYNWFEEGGAALMPKENAALRHYFLSRGFQQTWDRMNADWQWVNRSAA